MIRLIAISVILIVLSIGESLGQCSMCRTQLENNYSTGSPGIAAGINVGILYLLALPYLAVLILGYLWYKSSKNVRPESNKRYASR